MSLAIDAARVIEVLLPDGWHRVSNFQLDAYEYMEYYEDNSTFLLFGGGQSPLITSTGFTFIDEQGRRIDGPLTSILAVVLQTGKK
jgi:hypothetical protein